MWTAEYSRDDGMIVSVSPPIPSNVYSNRDSLKEIVIFSRHMGESLFPMSALPMYVNICVINTDSVKVTGKAKDGDLTFSDIGVIGNIDQVNERKYKDAFGRD